MAAYCRVYDLCHLQADCQEPGSAPEPCARKSSTGYIYLFTDWLHCGLRNKGRLKEKMEAVVMPTVLDSSILGCVITSTIWMNDLLSYL